MHKKILYVLLGAALMVTGTAYAAPVIQNFTNIAPFVTDTYDNGTSTQRWLHVFTKFASTTALSVTGQTTGCAQFNSSGALTSTGTNCQTSNFSYPFPLNATTTTLTFSGGLVSVGSTTINGNATTTGTFFATTASSTNLFGANLATCNGSQFLQWSAGLFACGTPSGGSSFSYPFPLSATSSPLMLLASTTIGAGTDITGLTVNGGATSTLRLNILPTGTAVGTAGLKIGDGSTGGIAVGDGILSKSSGSLWVMQGINLGGGSAAVVAASFGTISTGLYGTGSTISQSISGVEKTRLSSTGALGIATTSPFAKLSIHGNPNDTTLHTTLFAIGSSTATATTTLFSIGNTGTISTQLGTGCVSATGGVLSATGSCGGSAAQLPTYIVKASGGDFTTIQGALDACGTHGGATINLLDATYNQAGTGLTFKGSNCNIYGRDSTTTITFTGATTLFKTNSAAGLYSNNGIHHVVITADGNASGVAVDISDMTHSTYEDIRVDNVGTCMKVNDTQNITFYNMVDKLSCTTVVAFGINASSTNPVNGNIFNDIFIGGSANSIALQLNNGNNNLFTGFRSEPASVTGTVGIKLFDNTLATNDGVFDNQFINSYIEANGIGISIAASVNGGGGGVQRNKFMGGIVDANTTDLSIADYSKNSFEGVDNNFSLLTSFQGPFGINTGIPNAVFDILDPGFSSYGLRLANNINFAHNSLDFAKISLLNGSDTSNLLNLSNLGTGATIIATSTRGTDFILTGGRIGIGTTSPFANLSVHASAGATNKTLFAIASSTATATTTLFKIDNKGHEYASTTQPVLSSCGTSPTITGNDKQGEVVPGATATGCTVTFGTSWDSAPICTVSNQSMSITSALTYTISATALTISQATGVAGNKIDYMCRGVTTN